MEWIFGGISLLFGVIGYLLSAKDRQQSEEIVELKAEHRKDVDSLYGLIHSNEEKLAEHKLAIAQNHYTQPQIDNRFLELNNTMKEGFRELSVDIKAMTEKLTDHMVKGGN